MVVHGVTGTLASIVGGYHALGKLASGSSIDDAVAALQDDQRRLTWTADDQNSPEGIGQRAMDSPSAANPLTWPARAGGTVGNLINSAPNQVMGVDISGPKAAVAAGADAATQVLLPLKAGAIARTGAGTLRSLSDLGRISPEEAATNAAVVKARAMAAVGQASPAPSLTPQPSAVPEPVVAQGIPQASAASVAPTVAPVRTPTIADASPEIQQAVVNAANAGKPISPEVVQRHVDADTLPVPVQLTKGQALMDPATISNEMNSRGKAAPQVSPEFYNQQGKALGENLDAIRQKAAPDVPPSNPTEHGQTMVDEYKGMDAPVVADISAKYKALEDANGGNFPIDGQQLAANTQAALDKALKSGSVPTDLQANLNQFANGRQMTFQDFETMRSDAADAQRTAADGRQRAAAGIIRDQLEQMPLTPEAAQLKPLADAARAAAKARFDAMDADPAYAAAVGDGVPRGQPSPLADTFVQKYLIGAPRANVLNMRSNLAGSPVAMQTIPAATMDYLKSSAKADAESGKFASDSFNTTAAKLAPKFDALLDPDSAALVGQVGRVAKYTSAQPKGSFVNNSNTLVGAAGKVGLDFAKSVLAAKTGGLSNVAGGLLNTSKAGASAKASVAPGAGIGSTLDGLTGGNE
jgi:hypothetical protein